MKKLTLLFSFMLAITITSCDNKTENTSASQPASSATVTSGATDDADTTTPPTQETIDELSKAVTEEHINPDITYTYDATTNTVIGVKEVDLTSDQIDEVEEFNKLVNELKNSTKPGDTTIKNKGVNIIVHYVNKVAKDTITDIPITPEDLK